MEIKEIKYTVSIVLVIIGVLSFGFLAVDSYSMVDNLETNDEFREYIENTLQNQSGELSGTSEEELVDFFGSSVLFMVTVSVISAILGIVAVVFLNKRKKVKLVGILLIVIAILSIILTLILGIIGGIAYLIAGIITLVKYRKVQNAEV